MEETALFTAAVVSLAGWWLVPCSSKLSFFLFPTVVDEIKIQPNPYAVLSERYSETLQSHRHSLPLLILGVFVLSQVEKEVEFGNVDKVTKSMVDHLTRYPSRKVEVSVEQEERELAAARNQPPPTNDTTAAVNNAVSSTHGRSPSESNAIAALAEASSRQ